ncbi:MULTISPECIES: FadR/GntR family transcriptional regulator [Actinomadura]|uniref:FadR/GntR family transcriptional regulator n=1 Tax=Actinomadura yumaensis TaxID=111807 RepID=A0ABW2D1M5_9ACTN|nr:FCD domain-containing protein [Actinomadura sp. J1-007]MWK34221.1 FCD domain-containing protein [Actinomadura sp. J1-007]
MAETPASPGFRAVKWVSPTQQIREQLLKAIRLGELAPGAALPSERELCEVFGVSRVSVREALAGLEAMGLISVRHGRGAFVREGAGDHYAGSFGHYIELHRDQMVELLAVRGALDELAAQEAAAHGTSEALDQMLEAHRAFLEAASAERPEFTRIAELDVAFHLSVAQAAPGGLLKLLLQDLHGLLTDSRLITLARPGQLPRSAAEHQSIVEAILARDPSAAGRLASDHVTRIREWAADFTAPNPIP